MADVINITGLDNVLDLLKSLPPDVVSKRGGPVLRALRKGARVIRDEERRRVPVDSGELRDSLGVFRRKYEGKGERVQIRAGGIGMRKYVKNKANIRSGRATQSSAKSYEIEDLPAVYGRFLEFGTSKMQARPWARPAFAAKAQEAIQTVARELIADLDKLIRRLGKKGGLS